MDGEWIFVAGRRDILADVGCPVQVNGRSLALFDCEGAIHATDNWCTHGRACLSDGFFDGEIVECPLHQGMFDVKTGKAIGAPASVDLPTYAVKVEGDNVFVLIPVD